MCMKRYELFMYFFVLSGTSEASIDLLASVNQM